MNTYSQFSHTLYSTYESYKDNRITTNKFKHADLTAWIDSYKQNLAGILSVEKIGESSEGRSINLLTLGTGKTKVFMWSQMHGDEATATMGLMDMLSYINAHKSSPEVQKILSELTLLIIPMLNPDGAERWTRRTAQGIDMNRDAVSLQTPEARLLKSIRDTYNPEIGFNLHDQDPRYSTGEGGKVSTIALLAPSFDYAKTDNAVRLRAKKITAELVGILKPFIPENISRYDDAFEPRAFGDNVQKWGTSTILIESGGWYNDPAKMYIRKLNCVMFLAALHSIATRAYEQTPISEYEKLPLNAKTLFYLLIHNATITFANGTAPLVADIAINYEQDGKGKIMDIGDLRVFTAHENISAEGKKLEKTFITLDTVIDMNELKAKLK